MKKIQRLSLYKKKKVKKSELANSSSSEQANGSPTKSPFKHALKKKFFSGKSLSRSQSMPEESVIPALNSPAEEFMSVENNDVFTDDDFSEEDGPAIPCNEPLGQPQCGTNGDFTEETTENQETQTLNPSLHNGSHSSAAATSGFSNGNAGGFYPINDNFRTTSNACSSVPYKEEVCLYSDHPLVEEDHVYDLPANNTPPTSTEENLPFSFPLRRNFSSPSSSHHQALPHLPAEMMFLSSNTQPGLASRCTLTAEFKRLATQGWYWGPLTRIEAEDKLDGVPDGSFLVRDSSDERYLLSLSFRSYGRTLHTRIEHSQGKFSFYTNNVHQTYTSVVDLIDRSMRDSEDAGVFCYSRSRAPYSPTLPVFLTYPISRLSQVRTLQYLCRFVIRQYTRIDHIEKLPLPVPVKGYLNQSYF